MNRTGVIPLLALLAFLYLPEWASGQGSHPLLGTWDLIPDQSTDIDHFGALTVELSQTGDLLTICRTWGRGRAFRDSLALVPGASSVDLTVRSWVFPSNIFMGLRMPVSEKRHVSALWEGEKRLRVDERFQVCGS